MEKEIIGYRLKDDKYTDACRAIVSDKQWFDDAWQNNTENKKWHFANLHGRWEYHQIYQEFKKAGVMHWFNPVYKEDTLKVGQWYIDREENSLWFYERATGGDLNPHQAYGINKDGDWCKSDTRCLENCMLATNEEIEKSLINEAKKRGYENGVIFNSIWCTDELTPVGIHGKFEISYSHYLGLMVSMGACSYTIFKDGHWAEIVESKSLPIIAGYEAEENGAYIKYGCQTFTKSQIRNLRDMKVLSLKISISDNGSVKVSKEQLQQIYEYLN